MISRHIALSSLLVVAALSAACAEPPQRDLDLAATKIEAARNAGAAQYAPTSMKAATEAETALQAEMAAQSSKWMKSFERATTLARTVQQASDKAVAEATALRERLLTAARANDPSVLGPNMFENGDFSAGTKVWFPHPQSDATIEVAQIEGARTWHVKYRKSNWAVINQELVLKPDTIYVYEAWVKSTAPVTSLYWQTDIGRYFETEKLYPTWTHVRSVIVTPHWKGEPLRASFNPVLIHATGEAWLRDVRISEVSGR